VAIPISALQRNAAEVVRRVAASGAAQEITDRGRVVAVLSPVPAQDGLERLRAMGLTRPATQGALAQALSELDELPSLALEAALAEQRDDDR